MVRALEGQNGPSESLRRLAEPGTVAIVTGQQVGLFSGPAYTIYKAITAARMARELTARGMPAVPVFWLATEDHDFEEVNHAWTFDASRQPVDTARSQAPGEIKAASGPLAESCSIGPPVDELRRALAGFPLAEEVMALVREAYRAGVTMGAAFRALLRETAGDTGVDFSRSPGPGNSQNRRAVHRRGAGLGSAN